MEHTEEETALLPVRPKNLFTNILVAAMGVAAQAAIFAPCAQPQSEERCLFKTWNQQVLALKLA